MARKKKAEQTEPKQEVKTEPKQEDKTVWHEGKPERPALYACKVNGVRTVLQFKKCMFSGRTYWLHLDGSDVDPQAKVEWSSGRADI